MNRTIPILLLLAGCSASPPEQPKHDCDVYWQASACPCTDHAYRISAFYQMGCRADQIITVEWEPQNTATRVENESRSSSIVLCSCKVRQAPTQQN